MKKSKTNVGASSARPHIVGIAERKNKGITLIALIITIIVMLILVGVSISIALNTGLFESAGKATGDYKTAQESEQELGSGKVNIAGIEYNSLEEYASTLTKEIPWIYEEDGNGNITITGIDFSNYPYTIENNVAYIDTGIETLVIPDELDGKKVIDMYLSDFRIDDVWQWSLNGIKTIILGKNLVSCNLSPAANALYPDVVSIIPAQDGELATIISDSLTGFTALTNFDAKGTKLRTIETAAFAYRDKLTLDLPNTITSIGDYAFNGVPIVNFPNGINENLTIPADKWGATKITIEGEEYVPGT